MAGIGQKRSQMLPPAPKFMEKDYPDQPEKISGPPLVHVTRGLISFLWPCKSFRDFNICKELSPERRLDVNWNMLALWDRLRQAKQKQVSISSEHSTTHLGQPHDDEQNYEAQLGTNCLGPFLFTQLLRPTLVKNAATSPPGSVRVYWTNGKSKCTKRCDQFRRHQWREGGFTECFV
jgi:hypothetical protein